MAIEITNGYNNNPGRHLDEESLRNKRGYL
jgi:hypothetical protein